MEKKEGAGRGGLKLGQLGPEDLDRVRELQDIVLAGLPDPMWFLASTQEEHRIVLDHGDMFGCLSGKKLVGFAVMTPWTVRGEDAYAGKLGEPSEGTLDVRDVMVHPEYRRRGIHSAFLRLFEETARITGGKALYATIAPENLPSIRAFEKAGYSLVKTQPAYDGRMRAYYRKFLK